MFVCFFFKWSSHADFRSWIIRLEVVSFFVKLLKRKYIFTRLSIVSLYRKDGAKITHTHNRTQVNGELQRCVFTLAIWSLWAGKPAFCDSLASTRRCSANVFGVKPALFIKILLRESITQNTKKKMNKHTARRSGYRDTWAVRTSYCENENSPLRAVWNVCLCNEEQSRCLHLFHRIYLS